MINDPIVSPWFIYAIGIADGFLDGMGAVGALLSIACVISFMAMTIDNDLRSKSRPWHLAVPPFVFFTWWFLFCLIPNSKTLIGMAVASQVTEARVIKTGKVVYAAKDDLKKDIIDIVLALKENPNDGKAK